MRKKIDFMGTLTSKLASVISLVVSFGGLLAAFWVFSLSFVIIYVANKWWRWKKKIQTTTTEEKSSTPSKPKRAYDKKKTSHHIQRKEKFLGHDRVMLYKTRSSDNFERTSPNSGYVSQTAHALFKTIYKGFTFGLTNQFCLYYDLMFTNLN